MRRFLEQMTSISITYSKKVALPRFRESYLLYLHKKIRMGDPTPLQSPHVKFLRIPVYVYLVWTFWIIAIYSFLLMIASPAINVKLNIRRSVASSFPQGWGFFTRNPLDPKLVVYRLEGNQLKEISFLNNSSKNIWGLSKVSRVVSTEAGKIVKSLPKTAWREGSGVIKIELSAITPVKLTQHSAFFGPGIYIFKISKVMQFSWTGKGQEQYTPYTIAAVRIESFEN